MSAPSLTRWFDAVILAFSAGRLTSFDRESWLTARGVALAGVAFSRHLAPDLCRRLHVSVREPPARRSGALVA